MGSNSKLYVGNLSWGTDNAALREAFGEHGEVADAKVITDRESGQSRGFAFVTYKNAADALRAIEKMDGCQLGGRSIRVREAEEKPTRVGGGNFGGGYGGGGNTYRPPRQEPPAPIVDVRPARQWDNDAPPRGTRRDSYPKGRGRGGEGY